MSDKKYTPGPWRMDIDPDGQWANQWPVIISESTGDEIVGTEGFYTELDKDIANARLASCAPELLEALETALEWIDAVPVDTQLPAMPGFDRDAVNDLISKAKGE